MKCKRFLKLRLILTLCTYQRGGTSSAPRTPLCIRRLRIQDLYVWWWTTKHQQTPGTISRRPKPMNPMPMMVAEDLMPIPMVIATGRAPIRANPPPRPRTTAGPRSEGGSLGMLLGHLENHQRELHKIMWNGQNYERVETRHLLIAPGVASLEFSHRTPSAEDVGN